MALLGFEAVGELALGQLPTVTFAVTTGPLVFTKFSEPIFVKKVDVDSQTEVRFRILRPDAATPGPLSFIRFSEPSFTKKVLPNQYTEPRFRILRPDSATPGPLVFTRFSEPSEVTF